MTPSFRRSVPAIAAILLQCALPAAAAPLMQSDMEFDWSTFAVTTSSSTGPAPTLTWVSRSSTIDGFATGAESTADWTSPLSTHIGDASSFADSSLDAGMLRASAQDSDLAANSSGSIWTLRQGMFSVVGSGNVEMSVNYTWHALGQPAPGSVVDQSFSYAYASLEAWSTGDPRFGGQRGGQQTFFPQVLSPPDVGSFGGSGKLVLDFTVLDGDQFAFTGAVSATDNLVSSPVPLPPSRWLFSCGLGVILALRWRRQPT